MKKWIIVIVIALMGSVLGYAGYNSFKYHETKKLVEKSIIKDDMNNAVVYIKKSMKYDMFSRKKDIITLQAVMFYSEAKEKYDSEDYEGAEKALSNIQEKILEYKHFATKIDALRTKVSNSNENKKAVDLKIEEIREVLDVGDYKTALSRIKSVGLMKLTNEQKSVIEDMNTRASDEMAKLNAEEEARKEAERMSEEARKIEENRKKEEEIEQKRAQEEKEAEEKRKIEKYGRSKYSREEARKIFLEKSQFDEKLYKVEIINSEDYKFNGDLCYFIRVTDIKNPKASKKEYYINSYTGSFTLAKNLK